MDLFASVLVFADGRTIVGTAVVVLLAIAIIVKGVFGIRNRSIRLKYGIEMTGPSAVGWGWFFVIVGVGIIVIAIIVALSGPLLP